MALTRKFLAALGIEADKVDEIINAHTETVDGLKEQLVQFKADAEKLPAVQKELDEMKAAAEKAGKDPFKVKYEAIKEEFEQYKADQTAKETKAAKSAAYRALLKEAGVAEKRLDAVLKVSDLESIELDKDGTIKGADKLAESIKTEWADFISSTDTAGAKTTTPPTTTGGTKYASKSEIMAIKDTGARQRAIAENIQLFR